MAIYPYRGGFRAQVYVRGVVVASATGFRKKSEAKAWHDKTKLDHGSESKEKKEPATYEELLALFKERHLKAISPGTATRYQLDIDQRITGFFRFQKLERITPSMLETFKTKLMGSGLKPKSVNNCLDTLRLMLNKAVKWNLIEKSPWNLETLDVPDNDNYVWWDSQADIQKFLKVAKERSRYYPVYLLALETGMRFGEIHGLSKKDIDFEIGRIHVHRQWLERQETYGPPKHRKPRHVWFDPKSELAQLLWRSCRESKHPEAVFTTATGARPSRRNLAEKLFKSLQRRAGVPVIAMHGLRHTYASWFMILVGDQWKLMQNLGHSSEKTMRRYAHHSKRHHQQPLNLSQKIAHESHNSCDPVGVSICDDSEKGWRDGRDLNPLPPILQAV
jgi:integrase